MLGEPACGDTFVITEQNGVRLFAVVDALGHGPEAEQSARKLVPVLTENAHLSLFELFARCDRALAGLRQVVMAAVRVQGSTVSFAGVGNVEIHGPTGVARPTCTPGTVGAGLKRVREYSMAVAASQRWILVSDGIQVHKMAPALSLIEPMLAARAARELVKLAGRDDDDATALVIDIKSGP